MMRADSIEAVKVLRTSFSDDEWLWLQEEPAFTDAMRRVTSLEEVDRVCRLGCELIRAAEEGKPGSRVPPTRRARS